MLALTALSQDLWCPVVKISFVVAYSGGGGGGGDGSVCSNNLH